MSLFRFADTAATETITHPSGEFSITLRCEAARGEIINLYRNLPTDPYDSAVEVQRRTWKMLVKDWSLLDEQGRKVEASFENFRKLHEEGARWISDQLRDQYDKVSPPAKLDEVKNEQEKSPEESD